jgi:hypothetical protein
MDKKNIFNIFLVTLLLFAVVGIASAKDEGQAASGNVGFMERMKNAYTNFKERQQKDVVKEAPKSVQQQQQPAANAVKAKVKAEAAKQEAKKELTRDEMLAELKDDLAGASDELFDALPGLKAEKVAEGKFTYTYKGVKLDELSAEELKSLSIKVAQTNTKLRTEQIQRQLNAARQAQQLTRPITPPKPVMPPVTAQIPKIPASTTQATNVPTTPPSVSKPPSPPAAPPPTRR